MGNREIARAIANNAVAADRPLAWFDELYTLAAAGEADIPWADLKPNPNVTELLDRRTIPKGRKALKVGCGLGDDAEYLSRKGFQVTAFDISPAAIKAAKQRFPSTAVEYVVANLLTPQASWHGQFDLVWESYTLQVLPAKLRAQALTILPKFVAPGGELIVVTRGREEHDPEGQMPWPLTKAELRVLNDSSLACVSFEDYVENETPPVRRYRAVYKAPTDTTKCNQPRRDDSAESTSSIG